MAAMVSQITGISTIRSNISWGAHQIKHQSSVLLAFVREIYRWPVYFPLTGPVTRKIFPFDDVIMWDYEFHTTLDMATSNPSDRKYVERTYPGYQINIWTIHERYIIEHGIHNWNKQVD